MEDALDKVRGDILFLELWQEMDRTTNCEKKMTMKQDNVKKL